MIIFMLNRIKRVFEYAQDEEEKIDVPRPYLIMVDETEYWNEKTLKKAGKIFAIYLVDKGNPDSYGEFHLRWLYNQVKNYDNYHIEPDEPGYDDQDEDLLNNIEEENGRGESAGWEDPDMYVKDIDSLKIIKQHRVTAGEMESITKDDYDEIIDNCREEKEYYEKELMDEIYGYYRGNRIF